VATQVCSIFSEYKRDCRISPAETVSVADIRHKPVISIGRFSNPWTLRLLAPLSYQTQLSGPPPDGLTSERMVVENTPARQIQMGKIGPAALKLPMTADYAIVAKFHSDVTYGMAVVVAGLGRQGTHTGELYVCSPEDMRTILSRAPKGWTGVNFEAVLKVNLIQGSSATLKLLLRNSGRGAFVD